MKRKVIEFITNLSDGGAENLVKEYALLIDKDKFDISVVTIRNFTDTAVYKALKEKGIKVISVYPTWNIIIKLFNKLFGYHYINWRLKLIFKQENADVIHAHLFTLKYLHRIQKSLKKFRLFYTCHSVPHIYFEGIQGYYAKELHDHNGLCIIALHDDMRIEINKLLAINDTIVLHNGIDFKKFENAQGCRGHLRNILNIPEESFVIGHIGRFHAVKNHEFLVKVFLELSKRQPHSFLLMVGDGEEKEHIRQELDNQGMQGKYLILSNRTDVPELMQIMDVFVFPSKFEGLGIALVEAQISGLKCVISDAIPDEVLLTEHIMKVGLNEPVKKWCDVVLDNTIKGTPHGKLEDYDLNQEIKKLERLYLH